MALSQLTAFTDLLDDWDAFEPALARGHRTEAFPRCTIFEREDCSIIRAECPGVPKDKIQVDVHGNELILSGEIRDEPEDKNTRVHLKERRTGRFRRVFTLPDSIQAEKISADMKDGLLEVRVPKAVINKVKIPIKSAADAAAAA